MGRPRGIDVFSGTGRVDWRAVAGAGYSFVFVKATEGTDYTNPLWREQYAGAKAAGLLVGLYHYDRPGLPADEQAHHFIATVGKWKVGDLQPALDMEEWSTGYNGAGRVIPPDTLTLHRLELAHVTEALAGRQPIIYSYPWEWQHNTNDTRSLSSYPLWGARYNNKPPNTGNPLPLWGGWPQWSFWQYTSTGVVPGVPPVIDPLTGTHQRPVDCNVFNGGITGLRRFAGL